MSNLLQSPRRVGGQEIECPTLRFDGGRRTSRLVQSQRQRIEDGRIGVVRQLVSAARGLDGLHDGEQEPALPLLSARRLREL